MAVSMKRIHYGWLILIALSVMQLGVLVLTNTVASLFATPMAKALGIDRSVWMLWLTFYAFGFFFSAPVWGNLFQNNRVSIKLILGIGLAMYCICLLLFAFCTALWMAYLGGFLCGVSQVGLRSQAMPVFASNWFSEKRRGGALGVVNCANGIGGAILSPIIQIVIAAFGTTVAYLSCMGILIVLCLPWILFVFVRRPEDMGLHPVGYDPKNDNVELANDIDLSKGRSTRFAIRTPVFWLLVAGTVLLSIAGGFKTNVTGIAMEFLEGTPNATDAAFISALMLSIISISDLMSNLAFGFMADKRGIFLPSMIFLCATPLLFVFWLLFGSHPYGLYLGALCYGIQGAILRNCLPLTLRRLFGPRDFSKIFGRVYMWKGLTNGFAAVIIASFYDFGGGYPTALVFGLIAACIAGGCFFYGLRLVKKNPYQWEVDKSGSQAVIKRVNG